MQYQENIVIVCIETSILVGLEDRIPIELVEVVLGDDRIDLIKRRIDSVEPDSGRRWSFCTSHLIVLLYGASGGT